MSARDLIGLEAAIAELGSLYLAAKNFTALRARAEEELRRGAERMAADLRAHARHRTLDALVVDRTAQRVAALRSRWQRALEETRAGAPYRAALDAWRCADAPRLRVLLPEVFVGLVPVPSPPALFVDVALSSGRRGGAEPFLTAEECSRRIVAYRDDGLAARESEGADFAYLEMVGDVDLLESPVGLRFGAGTAAAVFALADEEHAYRVYAPALRAPFAVLLREHADDAWWQASEPSYEGFRDELAARLAARGLGVEIVA